MDVSNLAPYAKTVVAIAGAIVVTATALSDGEITADDVVTIVAAWGTVIGVYQVKNKKKGKS